MSVPLLTTFDTLIQPPPLIAPGEFVLGTIPPEVTFQTNRIPPPSPFYLAREESFLLRIYNALAGTSVVLFGRFLLPSGEIIPFQHRFTPTSDRALNQRQFFFGEGYLMNVFIEVQGTSAIRGQTFAILHVIHGDIPTAIIKAILISDYITAGTGIGWPGGRLHASIEGPGAIRIITGINPTAGSEISESVPTNARWRLIGLRLGFNTNANVAARRPKLIISNGPGFAEIPVVISIPASTVAVLTWLAGGAAYAFDAATQIMPLANDMILPQETVIETETSNLQAGDDYSPPQFQVEEWIEE